MSRFVIFVLMMCPAAHADVWVSSNAWSPAWEDRYAEWVRERWTVDLFASPTLANGQKNPYAGLRVDCADAVYSMRAIFSYENGLPFAINDPTGGRQKISNAMSRFDRLNGDQKIRAFLQMLYGTVSTRSLPNDTFSVPITRAYVHSGAVMRTVEKNHHSWTVKEILPTGVPWLIFASTLSSNSSATLYQRQSWPNPAWVFEGDVSPAGGGGFRNFRPLDLLEGPEWRIPGYSEEQFRVDIGRWVKFAQSRLALRQETDEQMLERLTLAACEDLRDRVGSIDEGLKSLRANPGRCMSYAAYDQFSTPSRDHRFFDDLAALRKAYKDLSGTDEFNRSLERWRGPLRKIFPFITQNAKSETAMMPVSAIDGNSLCPTPYAAGRTVDLAEAKRRLFAGLLSNNPHDELEYRWGEKAGPSPLAARCPSWDHWSPDLSQAN